MSNLHNLSDADFAAYEADMFGASEETFDAWVISMEHEGASIDGWRDLEVWIDEGTSDVRRVDVQLDGELLYWSVYYKIDGAWVEAEYHDGDEWMVRTPEMYEELGWTKALNWRWNEFTDEWDVPTWAFGATV